jgi:hypothetical protein
MSDPTAPDQPLPPIDPGFGLIFGLAELLSPLFKTGPVDSALAHRMAISAIEAYNPGTRADCVNVARTIAFSMAALALLGAAASRDMTFAQQMRAFGRANALNRSADQSERTMMQRRRYQQANTPAEPPAPRSEPVAPDLPINEAELQAEIASVMQEYLATRPTQTETVPQPAPAPAGPGTNAPRPPQMKNPHRPPAATPATAIHDRRPSADPAQSGTTPYQDLLRRSRPPHLVHQIGAQQPT